MKVLDLEQGFWGVLFLGVSFPATSPNYFLGVSEGASFDDHWRAFRIDRSEGFGCGSFRGASEAIA